MTTKRNIPIGSKVLQKEQFIQLALDLSLGSSITDKGACDKSLKIAQTVSPFAKVEAGLDLWYSEFPRSYIRVPYQ